MSIKETLKEEREKYWNTKLQDSIEKIREYILKYQKETEFLTEEFIVKLYVEKYVEKIEPNGVYNVISMGMYEQILDNGNMLVGFKSDEAVRHYLNKLNAILEDEGAKVIYTIEDLSEDKIKLREKLHILTARIVI